MPLQKEQETLHPSGMRCRFCKSANIRVFAAEMNIHFTGIENLRTPTVMVFPPVAICLECGSGNFLLQGEPLKKIRDRSLAQGLRTAWLTEQSE
jgi:hypothetical protein